MRIAFFGQFGSFGHEGLGGTESIVRRLSYALSVRGYSVGFVRYLAPTHMDSVGNYGVVTHDVGSLSQAFKVLNRYDHVVTTYLRPQDRIAYAIYRLQCQRSPVFHVLYQDWPESNWKRLLATIDGRLIPYSGRSFCVSPRIWRNVSRWAAKAALLWPPVPDSFFLNPQNKPSSGHLRVTYMGRLDPRKGARVAIDLFKRLSLRQSDIETCVFGYYWNNDPQGAILHYELSNQNKIKYIIQKQEIYSPDVDRQIHSVLRDTDVLFLPYEQLSSTIDSPLVILEGMAHLCAVVTRPLGDLPYIYGSDGLMFMNMDAIDDIERKLLMLKDSISVEQSRIYKHLASLKCNTSYVTNGFVTSLLQVVTNE